MLSTARAHAAPNAVNPNQLVRLLSAGAIACALGFGLGFAAPSAHAQSAQPPAQAADTQITATTALEPAAEERSFVQIQEVTSPGGIEAWLVSDDTLPILALEFSFENGAASDPAGKTGLGFMISGLLDEGAGDLDSQAFQTKLKDLSIGLSFDASRDHFSGSFRTLTKYQDEAVDLLRLAVNEPRFDEAAFTKVKDQINVILTREQTDPDSMAGKALFSTLFGEHPYGQPVRGTLDTVNAITLEDVRAHHKALFSKERLRVAAVGAIDPEALGVLLDAVFGALPEASSLPAVTPASLPESGADVVVEKDIPQSVVLIAGEGLKRDDPDFIPAFVMNYVLGGGGFASRLMEEVREKRGLAYSVYSYFNPLDEAGLFIAGVGTQNERVRQSIDLIKEEIGRMQSEGLTAEELQSAKDYLTGSYPLRFDSNSKIAGQLIGLQLQGLSSSYVNDRNGLIEAVTLEDIKRVAARLPAPEDLTVVIVGNPSAGG